MSWFMDFLTDTARQSAPGIHKGINDDQQKKRDLEQARSGIPIEVERQKALMPGELEKIRAGETSRNENALRLLMIGKELDRKRVLEVEEAKTRRTNGENPFLSFLTSRVETPQNPAVMPVQAGAPGYGAGEEATSGIVPKTRTEPWANVLMRGMGLDPSEREAVPSVSGTGKVGVTFQRKPNESKPTAPHYLSKPDGSTWVVDTPGAEPRQIQPAIKTAQPLTSEATAAAFAGVPEGQRPNPDQAKKMNEYLAGRTGERRGATIEAEAAHAPAAARYAAAKARAIKDVGLEYLPIEVRTRAQEALNVATDPANVSKIASKIEQETQAKLGAAYAPESITGPIVLLQTTEGALNELKTRFTPQEREKYVGILLNPALRAMQLISPDPRFAEFQAIMGRVKKSAFDDGGKQLTPFEFSVVSQYIPQGNENSWQDFEAKLAIAGDYTRMLINARSEISTMTRKRLGAEGVPQIRLNQGKNIPVPSPQGAAPQNNDPLGIRR